MPANIGEGDLLRDRDGHIINSRLNESLLRELTQIGHGIYVKADYRDQDSQQILQRAAKRAVAATATDEKTRVWNERFYWMLLPVLLMLLPVFRRSPPRGSTS